MIETNAECISKQEFWIKQSANQINETLMAIAFQILWMTTIIVQNFYIFTATLWNQVNMLWKPSEHGGHVMFWWKWFEYIYIYISYKIIIDGEYILLQINQLRALSI